MENLSQDIFAVTPLIILFVGAMLLLLLDAFIKGSWSRSFATSAVLVMSFAMLLRTAGRYASSEALFSGTLIADPLSLFVSGLILIGAFLSVLLSSGRLKDEKIDSPSEYYALLLMATAGALIFVMSSELISLFLGLEIMSMAAYCLCASAPSDPRSTESGLKYFLLGSFSSAFLLYGIVLLYGLTGTTNIPLAASILSGLDSPITSLALGLMLVGLVFKIGGVPFHFWTPDVYEGAPTSVTAYMASVIKVAAVAALLRILWGVFGYFSAEWAPAIWILAVLTMVVGNLLALRQRSIKRMLAFSSVAHAGYLLVALLSYSAGDAFGAGSAILYYLVAYTLMTIGSFGVVLAITSTQGGAGFSDDISIFHGLGASKPFYAILMTLFLFALAGLPPGMAGLLGKVYIFYAAIQAGYVGLAIIGVLCSAISLYYYLRVVVAMYFIEPSSESRLLDPSFSMRTALVVCGIGVLLLGIIPSLVYDRAAGVLSAF